MLLEHLLVLLRLVHAEVREQFAALGNLAEQSPAGGVILLVLLEVIREHRDFLRKNSDLNLRRARILFVELAIRDQLLFGAALERHGRDW